MEERLRRSITEAERRQIAIDVLGKYRALSKSADRLVAIITDEVQTQGIEEAETIAGTSDTEAEAEAELEAQALCIAGANLDDDEAFMSFADMITGGDITNAGLRAGVRAAVLHQLVEFGFDQSVVLADTQEDIPQRGTGGHDIAPVRPLRYYVFEVPGWSAQHDQVVDAAAEAPLEMPIAIDRTGDVTRVFVAEDPEPLWGVRRWRLVAMVLAFPDLSIASRLDSPGLAHPGLACRTGFRCASLRAACSRVKSDVSTNWPLRLGRTWVRPGCSWPRAWCVPRPGRVGACRA